MLIKEYTGFFEKGNHDQKKNVKNDKKPIENKRVRNQRKKVSK